MDLTLNTIIKRIYNISFNVLFKKNQKLGLAVKKITLHVEEKLTLLYLKLKSNKRKYFVEALRFCILELLSHPKEVLLIN